MAPDLSSLHSSSTQRRPRAATSVLPTVVSPSSASRQSPSKTNPSLHSGSPPLGSSEHGITSSAQGPLRHPKPLTPSDLHMVLEKEQEAMVNRLTRELSVLRQQTASVASTASSTTSNFNDSTEGFHQSPTLGSSTQSHSSRQQRSSSSLSAHTPSAQGPRSGSVSGIAPTRESNIPSRPGRSRQASLTSRRPSVGSLSSYSSYAHGEHYSSSPSIYPHRNSVSQTYLGQSGTPMTRCEEAAFQRSELDIVKRENELLRKRVRELEGSLKKLKEEPSEAPTGADV